ncbi:far upstream element-binding protein 1-like isoform X1 [Olea europaea var. sylvestris]|uniref:far upstream element-binding protein 1-like isoform X1 n=1 Tax=Olea europaea var. sylvestris TaxID=158386 RepID=UPI000C1D8737|nr:far upstream element-binding protein 1-like isoform X1 [Olea europaea var. sylvestris]
MAEELYARGVGESNKRKYEDHKTSPAIGVRRPTGFSSPPPPSYNSVPPPMNEIELAKQKAQEIAARLLNSSDPTKRARVENGAGGGFDSNDQTGFLQKPVGLGLSFPPQVASYGYPGGPGQSKKIEIPNGRVGVIIGKGGETIRYLQVQSGAKIQVTRDMDADHNSATRDVELMGTPDQIEKAEQLINDVLAEADAGGSGAVSRQFGVSSGQFGVSSGSEQFVMKIANNKVGLVIGKGGETIKNMQARSGARIQVIPLHLPPGDTSTERTLQIDGTSEQIEIAKQLVNEVSSENRLRNPAMSGGYPQQGYQARPPANWGQPGPPMQQPGYGYVQPGAYPGPSPQYNLNQPPYAGYPPQPTSGGYATAWDQTTAPPNQPPAQEGGYDYYSQQPPPQQQAPGGSGPPMDSTAYGYNQPPAYNKGQVYPQDSYGGYYGAAPQSGYGQPPANPAPGYDQQQPGYNATYSNVSNPTPDGHTPTYGTQGDANQAPAAGQPNPNPNYAPQGSTQPTYGELPTSQGGFGTQPLASYGPPQVQKPPTGQPAYGQQPQQSPSSQGGYVQPGYPHSQPPPAQTAYSQTDSGQRPPSSTYPTTQAGYGPPTYGTPQLTQLSYGQQQPPPYNSSYGGGYSQPPAYPADGSTGGSAVGSYDAAPTSQIAQQPSQAPKASPPA